MYKSSDGVGQNLKDSLFELRLTAGLISCTLEWKQQGNLTKNNVAAAVVYNLNSVKKHAFLQS